MKAKIFGKSSDGSEETKGNVAIFCPGCDCKHVIATKQQEPNGPVWGFNHDFAKPTFTPSLLVRSGKYVPGHEDYDDEGYNFSKICHSFITDGNIQFLNDCTHELKGKTVELPEIE